MHSCHPKPRLHPKQRPHEFGGAALEYVLVSSFAAIITITALGFIGKAFKDQLNRMTDRLGIDTDVDAEMEAAMSFDAE